MGTTKCLTLSHKICKTKTSQLKKNETRRLFASSEDSTICSSVGWRVLAEYVRATTAHTGFKWNLCPFWSRENNVLPWNNHFLQHNIYKLVNDVIVSKIERDLTKKLCGIFELLSK